MSHVVCSQVFRVDSRLFLVGSQIGNLTPGPSFGHNLCFRCPNEQCEPILDIYVSRAFQWYKERHKWLRFDASNWSLKFLGVHRDSISQLGSCLGSVRVHSLTLSCTPGSLWCDSRKCNYMAHPTVWPIQKGINLMQNESTTLKKARISFDCLCRSNAWSLFGSQSSCSNNSHVHVAASCPNLVRPSDASCWPTTCGYKKVRRPSVFKLRQQHTNNWEASILLL